MTRDELKDILRPHVIKLQGMSPEESNKYQQEHILPLATAWFANADHKPMTDLFHEWNDIVMEIANEFTVH